MSWKCLWLAGFAALSVPAGAVVVLSGNTNNSAPSGQPYFGNVGAVGGASAVYLGDGWVLSASHVAGSLPATASFGGVSYATAPGTFHQLQNPPDAPGLSTFTDLVVFRLVAPPALPGLPLATAAATVGDPVMMIGNGFTQQASRTYWDRTVVPGPSNDVWVETTPSMSNISGYQTTGTQEVRWGLNDVSAASVTVNAGFGDVISFITSFDEAALAEEGQAVVGDSGGGVFTFTGSGWILSGMMHAVGTLENQPGGANSAVPGDATAIADISRYRAQILAIVPEPSSAMLGLAGLALLARRRR